MIHVYLVYGLAFIFLGFVSTFQAGTPVRVLPLRAMVLLGLFGVLHGCAEWIEIAKSLHPVSYIRIQITSLFLTIASFTALVAFGLELLVMHAGLSKWGRGITLFLLLAWFVFGVSLVSSLSGDPDAFTTLEVGARYLLAFPGAVFSCMGLFAVARSRGGRIEERLYKRLRWAAVAFGAYAVFGGLIVPEAAFGPARVINTSAFSGWLGIPVVFLRAACALVISVALVQAFIVELARINSLWGRMREEFVSLVAHDLKSSLGGVTLASEMLVEELEARKELPDRVGKIARQIQTTAKGMGRIVSDLLDASLIAANRLKTYKQRVDLVEIVGAAVERARTQFGERELRWQPPEEPLYVMVDPVRIDQVLLNLLSNALKYSVSGTPVVVSLTEQGSKAVLMVSNKTEDVDLSELPLLFERYYRSQGQGKKSRSQGSGLGLFIVRGLVEASGGQVWVKALDADEVGFFVSLSLLEAEYGKVGDTETSRNLPKSERPGKRS